jgi:hypothetical protein
MWLSKNRQMVSVNKNYSLYSYLIIFFYNLVIESPHECIFNVRVYKKWDVKRIKEKGFVKKINNGNKMQ